MIKQSEEKNFIEVGKIDLTDAESNAKAATAILQDVKTFRIVNNDQYKDAAEMLKKIKAFAKLLDDKRKQITAPLDTAKKVVMDLFRGPTDALSQAESLLKNAMVGYQQEQEKIRQEQERRAQEAARAEEEKQRKAIEARAAKAEEKGNIAKAEELREKAQEVFVPRPVVASSLEKCSGVATKKVWKFRVTNKILIPIQYLVPDEKMIGEVVRATKGTISIPGVEVYCEDSLAVSTR